MEIRAEDQARAEQATDQSIAASAGTPAGGTDTDTGGRMPGEGESILDLVDVVSEDNGRGNQEIIVIDGRLYDRVRKPEDRIYELEDIVEQGKGGAFAGGGLNGEMTVIIAKTAEKIAREMIPGIAAQVIREEIEKLKRDHGMGTDH
jgi:hypothetical protein